MILSKTMHLSKQKYPYESWGSFFDDYKVDLTDLDFDPSWEEIIVPEFDKEYFKKIETFLNKCLEKTNGEAKFYPYPELLFNSLYHTPLEKVRVVILGQDPYFNSELKVEKEIPQAMGLSFSVPKFMKTPSSLNNIYKNLKKFGHIKNIANHGNLSFWAHQGCLLLNTILTVQKGCPNGHEKKWTKLTDTLIKFISDNTENIVFLLWGANAYKKYDLIDDEKHKIIVSSHPSGLSCAKPFKTFDCFNDTDHFGKANKYLKKHGKPSIIFEII